MYKSYFIEFLTGGGRNTHGFSLHLCSDVGLVEQVEYHRLLAVA